MPSFAIPFVPGPVGSRLPDVRDFRQGPPDGLVPVEGEFLTLPLENYPLRVRKEDVQRGMIGVPHGERTKGEGMSKRTKVGASRRSRAVEAAGEAVVYSAGHARGILLALAQSAPARLGGKITLRTGAGSLTFRSIADKMGEIPIEGERGDEYSLGER